MVSVPVCPASDGNRFWNVMRIVGTSRTQTVPAAPNVNVSGSVVVVVVDEVAGNVDDVGPVDVTPMVVVDGGDEVVVVGATDDDVVVCGSDEVLDVLVLDVLDVVDVGTSVVVDVVVPIDVGGDDVVVDALVVDVDTSVGTVRGLVPTTVVVPATVVVV
jgi:hypothetical protein